MLREGPDERPYKVVVNQEEQYSIWFNDKACPDGWSEDGKAGTKQECLDYISQKWSDMRPLSIRTQKAEGRSSR
jgi:MbtH protein